MLLYTAAAFWDLLSPYDVCPVPRAWLVVRARGYLQQFLFLDPRVPSILYN